MQPESHLLPTVQTCIPEAGQCLMRVTHAAAPALEGLPPPPAPASQLTPPSAATNGTVLHTPEAPPAAARADTTPPLPVTGIAAVAATPPAAEVSPRRPSDGSFCAPEAIKRIATDTNDSPNRVGPGCRSAGQFLCHTTEMKREKMRACWASGHFI